MSDPTSSSRINEIQRIFKEIKGLNAQISELRKSVQEGGSKDSDTDDSDIQSVIVIKRYCKDCKSEERRVYRDNQCRNCFYHANKLDLALVPRKCTRKNISYVDSPEKPKRKYQKQGHSHSNSQDLINHERVEDKRNVNLRENLTKKDEACSSSSGKPVLNDKQNKENPIRKECAKNSSRQDEVIELHSNCYQNEKSQEVQSVVKKKRRSSKAPSSPVQKPKSLLDMIKERDGNSNEKELPLKNNKIVCSDCKTIRVAFKDGKCYDCFRILQNEIVFLS